MRVNQPGYQREPYDSLFFLSLSAYVLRVHKSGFLIRERAQAANQVNVCSDHRKENTRNKRIKEGNWKRKKANKLRQPTAQQDGDYGAPGHRTVSRPKTAMSVARSPYIPGMEVIR
jgi:hypothetical protein